MGNMIRCHCGTYHYRNDPCPDDEPVRLTSDQLMEKVRILEGRSRLKAEIDAVYEQYWEAIDRERIEHQKHCKRIDAENARLAAINRAKQ